MKNDYRAVSCVIVVVLATASLSAQTRATSADLSGVVHDQSKAVLPGGTRHRHQ